MDPITSSLCEDCNPPSQFSGAALCSGNSRLGLQSALQFVLLTPPVYRQASGSFVWTQLFLQIPTPSHSNETLPVHSSGAPFTSLYPFSFFEGLLKETVIVVIPPSAVLSLLFLVWSFSRCRLSALWKVIFSENWLVSTQNFTFLEQNFSTDLPFSDSELHVLCETDCVLDIIDFVAGCSPYTRRRR